MASQGTGTKALLMASLKMQTCWQFVSKGRVIEKAMTQKAFPCF